MHEPAVRQLPSVRTKGVAVQEVKVHVTTWRVKV